MNKVRCEDCGRLVSANGGVLSKHRIGRSKPGRVKDMCKGSLRLLFRPASAPAGKPVARPKAVEKTAAQAAFADAAAG